MNYFILHRGPVDKEGYTPVLAVALDTRWAGAILSWQLAPGGIASDPDAASEDFSYPDSGGKDGWEHSLWMHLSRIGARSWLYQAQILVAMMRATAGLPDTHVAYVAVRESSIYTVIGDTLVSIVPEIKRPVNSRTALKCLQMVLRAADLCAAEGA